MKKFLILAFATLFATTAARASVVMTIDPTDLDAVKFTATGNLSAIDDSSSTSYLGVTLIGVFATPYFTGTRYATSSDLLSSGVSNCILDVALTADNFGNMTQKDINLYSDSEFETQIFSTSVPAFTGEAVFSLPGAVFTPGSTGDIIVGDTDGGSGLTIGQWQVIPEPSVLVLIAPFGLALALRRARLRGGVR